MEITYHKEYSRELGRDMEYKVYGHTGKPVLVFPTSNARFFQYEEFGMIETLRGYIESGRIQVWTADGIDWETFHNDAGRPYDRIRRHEQYYRYVVNELVPAITARSRAANGGLSRGIVLTGCSMGAFHSGTFYFRRPDLFDTVIALSGLYSTRYFFGNYFDDVVYYNSPIDYLPSLGDPNYLEAYRHGRIILCCGQGAWEDEMIPETRRMGEILAAKNIPAWVDIWGKDVNHDWFWWKKQIVYFLERTDLTR
jgi:esterase/lipase superfamily enzyme